ncbi:hypothetical protein ACHAPT_008686 [Fusarium lateritium]
MPDRSSIDSRHGMRLRSRAWKWIYLPAEIRFMILDAITTQKHPGWASFSAVSKEWQLFIAKRNLCRLKLQVSCLDDLGRLIIRQRGFVEHIWLDIELPEYSCRCCKRQESCSGVQRNHSTISGGIWKLFQALSTWKTAKGLTLELNAHSPSDSEHWFKNCHVAPYDEDAAPVQDIDCSWHDPQHGWINGQQVKGPPQNAILRFYGASFALIHLGSYWISFAD